MTHTQPTTALHAVPAPHPDYQEARLQRLALQTKVSRLRDELETALSEFRAAIHREDQMQGHHD